MARKPRQEIAGGIHHLWARGNDRKLIYRDIADYERYLAEIRRVVRRMRWRCLSYCLMPNHAHLLVLTPETNLGDGMQLLHGEYAQEFNKRHARSGHVFQGRFGSKPIKDDEHLWTVASYIALNPVEARLCESPARWRWSSFRATVEGGAPTWLHVASLLSFFEVEPGDGARNYAAFVHGRHAAGSTSDDRNLIIAPKRGQTPFGGDC